MTFLLAMNFIMAVSGAHAQIGRLTVAVDGMACPFCAYGVEKKLKGVEGVGSISIDMKEGTATLFALEGQSINFREVPGAIKDAGFTPGAMRIVARGRISMDERRRFFFQVHGQSFHLAGVEGGLKAQLLSRVESGDPVTVQGIVREEGEDDWKILLESVEEATP